MATPPDHPLDPRATFLIALARALHEAGAPAHRLEDTVDNAAQALGVPFDCLSQPTSLLLGIGTETRVLRVHPRPLHLGRLVAIDGVGSAVARRQLSPEAGLARLEAIATAPERVPDLAVGAATVVSTACSAVFLHATPTTIVAATGLGIVVAVLGAVARRQPGYGRIHELVASFVVAAAATALARVFAVSVPVLTLAGIISLLPGLTLTVALTELATGHLVSGTSRAMGTGVTFLQLGLGTTFGWKLAPLLPRALRAAADPLPDGAPWVVLPLLAAAYTVSYRARRADYPWILAVSAVAYAATLQGKLWLGPELGAAVGGLAVGLASNLVARLRRVPTAVTQVPGLLLLVPGSIGFSTFGAMLDDEVEAGVGAAFSTMVIAGSLVAGILAAGVLLPPRRSL